MEKYYDVMLVGAAVSGIGMAYHLKQKCPNQSFAMIDARDEIGGTWDVFKYPGIRSDSDMRVYAYSFKKWQQHDVTAEAPVIMEYLKEIIKENDLDKHIHLKHKLISADWSNDEGMWTLKIGNGKSEQVIKCKWLQFCAGYYSYQAGYRPTFKDEEKFQGQIIHTQQWPKDYDTKGKRFAVIGSGATAITLIPSLAKSAKHTTMVQRSPSYIFARPQQDPIAKFLSTFLPKKVVSSIARRYSVFLESLGYKMAKANPEKTKKRFREQAIEHLPEGYDIDKHFKPKYNPWDQRVCLAPGGDFYQTIKDGKASVITDEIASFTEKGIKFKSGEELDVDVIVLATGLNIANFGDAKVKVEGQEVDIGSKWIYKGCMHSGIPNSAISMGTITQSYTLKVELIADFVCRMLNYLQQNDLDYAVPELPIAAEGMPDRSIFENFTSGYLERSRSMVAKQGANAPWINPHSFKGNKKVLKTKVNDRDMSFYKANQQTQQSKAA